MKMMMLRLQPPGLATALLILYASGVFLVNAICDDLELKSDLEATLEQLEGTLNVTVVDTEPNDSYPEWGPQDVSHVFAVQPPAPPSRACPTRVPHTRGPTVHSVTCTC